MSIVSPTGTSDAEVEAFILRLHAWLRSEIARATPRETRAPDVCFQIAAAALRLVDRCIPTSKAESLRVLCAQRRRSERLFKDDEISDWENSASKWMVQTKTVSDPQGDDTVRSMDDETIRDRGDFSGIALFACYATNAAITGVAPPWFTVWLLQDGLESICRNWPDKWGRFVSKVETMIPDLTLPSGESSGSATQHFADERFSSSSDARLAEIASMSPTKFFDRFDSNLKQTPRQTLQRTLATFLKRQQGADFGSHADNLLFASTVNRMMVDVGALAICPGPRGKSPCTQPVDPSDPSAGSSVVLSHFRCTKHRDYANGVFYFEHADEKQAAHGSSATVPQIDLVSTNDGTTVTLLKTAI